MASPEESLVPFRSDPGLGRASWAAMMRPSCVTVQTCGDLPTIGPIVEGQPSTVFPLQTVSVPSNVNSYPHVVSWTLYIWVV